MDGITDRTLSDKYYENRDFGVEILIYYAFRTKCLNSRYCYVHNIYVNTYIGLFPYVNMKSREIVVNSELHIL